MTLAEFESALLLDAPPDGLPAPLAALWWDAHGDWARAHSLVDELETAEGMAVHAYLHRKEGVDGTPTTGMRVPAADSTGQGWRLSGRRSLRVCWTE